MRQSMAWLHTWTGLLVGWVLYFMFVTGTFGYVNRELDRWMRPEQPLLVAPSPPAELLRHAEARLRQQAADATFWRIELPVDRMSRELRVSWRPSSPVGDGKEQSERLDVRTGRPLAADNARDTGGGYALYLMHYELHYVPALWAYYLVGVCTMFMLVAILSGIIVHKKIFTDFFTFRPGKGQRSWLDAHNLLSVTALPFHVMITWSGLILFLFTYMPVALGTLYPEGPARERFELEVHGPHDEEGEDARAVARAAPLTPLSPLLARAEAEWGKGRVQSIEVAAPGREGARITIFCRGSGVLGPRVWPLELAFDGVTGEGREATKRFSPAAAETFRIAMVNVHEGTFAGPWLRVLYVVSGLAGSGMIATGLLLWSNKRKARLRETERPHWGIRLIDVLNLGTVLGLPIGIAAYFWANRLIPVGTPERAAWEIHSLFLTWGAGFAYALARPHARAWCELAWAAGALWVLLPLLNALTTERGLSATLPAGDWELASLDLGMLAAGIVFACVARTVRRKQLADAAAPAHALRSKRAAEAG